MTKPTGRRRERRVGNGRVREDRLRATHGDRRRTAVLSGGREEWLCRGPSEKNGKESLTRDDDRHRKGSTPLCLRTRLARVILRQRHKRQIAGWACAAALHSESRSRWQRKRPLGRLTGKCATCGPFATGAGVSTSQPRVRFAFRLGVGSPSFTQKTHGEEAGVSLSGARRRPKEFLVYNGSRSGRDVLQPIQARPDSLTRKGPPHN